MAPQEETRLLLVALSRLKPLAVVRDISVTQPERMAAVVGVAALVLLEQMVRREQVLMAVDLMYKARLRVIR